MKFIPCVEVFNNPDAFGTDGSGEFDWIANQIVAHDEMVKNIELTFHSLVIQLYYLHVLNRTLLKVVKMLHHKDQVYLVNLDLLLI